VKEYLEIETSFANREDALKMASSLLDAKLVACANMAQVASFYDWDGERCEAGEFLLRVKTRIVLERECVEFIKMNHPYKVPMITAIVKKVNAEYVDWVVSSVK